MIKVRLSAIDGRQSCEIPVIDGETLSIAVERSLSWAIKAGVPKDKYFLAVLNGVIIPKEKWEKTLLISEDNILIAPRIEAGEDNTQLIKVAAIIAVTYYSGGLAAGYFGSGTFAAGLATAGANIAATLLLNSLIPPPSPPGLEIGGSGGDVSSSQMYSITSQSNVTRKLNTVPKVYGTHRMFPIVAANPYTELQADGGGNLVQYFYAIYDFGLGPAMVRDIKIGDTPLGAFQDVSYRLVDLNKPATDEGIWDNYTSKTFEYYKGDTQNDTVSVALNKNLYLGDPLAECQAVRNASPNTLSNAQEITVSLVCPSGLYAFNAIGDRGPRSIALDIEFSKIGEDVWRGFNDPVYTSNSSAAGGDSEYGASPQNILGYDPGSTWLGSYFNLINTFYSSVQSTYVTDNLETLYPGITEGASATYAHTWRGILKGSTAIVLKTNPNLIYRKISLMGRPWGTVVSAFPHYVAGYTLYNLDTPLDAHTPLFLTKTFADSNQNGYMGEPPSVIGNNISTTTCMSEAQINGRTKITSDKTSGVTATFKFTPKTIASYKVRVTRLDTTSIYTNNVQDAMSWVGISTRFDRRPIVTDKRHVFLELKIRATNQLSGTIQNISGVVSSVIEVFDGVNWVKQVSHNPAWVFADLITGEVNKRAIAKSRLHTDSLLEWAAFCDQVPMSPTGLNFTDPRFQTNFILDYGTTLQSILNQVANAAQASLNIIDGKYGVLLDKLKTTPVQIFTPRNSSGFSSTRNYARRPDGVKVSFIDPSGDWEVREAVVYDTGFNENNAVTLDEVSSFACTTKDQAWRFGRYLLAQNRLRQENITISVDFEHLVCTRGDYVQLTQDVMKAGGSPARVKSVSGNTVVIDDGIETGAFSYGFIYRSSTTGVIKTNTLTVVSSDTFTFNGPDIPAVGDLVIIGVVGSIAIDCIVKSIDPTGDMGATLTLVERASAIYTSESTDSLVEYTPDISPTTNTEFTAPGEVVGLAVVDNYFDCVGAGLSYKVDLDWDVPSGSAYDVFEIWVDSGLGYNAIGTTKESKYTYTALTENLGVTHKFKILAVSASGKKLDIGSVGEVTATISRKSTPPSDVTNLNIDITGEVLQLFWDKIPDCSVDQYLIRYCPDIPSGTWERSIPLLRVDKNTNLAATQARTGVYFIKAIDFEGNLSVNASLAITTIPELFGLNIIATVTDFPALNGAKDRVSSLTGGLVLKNSVVGGVETAEYYPEGYYYYENFLNLGEIYTARLQSLIQAEGFTLQDLMSNWPLLSTLDFMSHAGESDWDVETQYRTTEFFNVMSDWTALSLIDPISEGQQDLWTAWKKFTIGDATGRIFQFRLRLLSYKVSVTPRVFDGTIKVDMPDRSESFENISVSTSGHAISYSVPFKGPGTSPNVQVSIETAQSGDYWTFDYKTLDGLLIRMWDKNNVAVARTIDVSVKGHGRKALSVI